METSVMRYQIADGILDFIHVFWVGFFWLPIGTVAMGSASIFGSLRDVLPLPFSPVGMVVLAALPIVSIKLQWCWLYCLTRACSCAYFGYLAYLCIRAQPISTGVIYSVMAIAAIALIIVMVHPDTAEGNRGSGNEQR